MRPWRPCWRLWHLDQTPACPTAITGARTPRVLGRLTPGSPQAWQRLLHEMAGHQPAVVGRRQHLTQCDLKPKVLMPAWLALGAIVGIQPDVFGRQIGRPEADLVRLLRENRSTMLVSRFSRIEAETPRIVEFDRRPLLDRAKSRSRASRPRRDRTRRRHSRPPKRCGPNSDRRRQWPF